MLDGDRSGCGERVAIDRVALGFSRHEIPETRTRGLLVRSFLLGAFGALEPRARFKEDCDVLKFKPLGGRQGDGTGTWARFKVTDMPER